MELALGMPEHIPNTQGHDIAGTAECKYRSALGVDESRFEFWLPHLSGLYNNEVPSTIEGSCSRVNFPESQCGVGPGKRGTRQCESGRNEPEVPFDDIASDLLDRCFLTGDGQLYRCANANRL